MVDKKTDLKACPFCGGKAILKNLGANPITKDPTFYMLECQGAGCGANVSFNTRRGDGTTKAGAVENWNRRTGTDIFIGNVGTLNL